MRSEIHIQDSEDIFNKIDKLRATIRCGFWGDLSIRDTNDNFCGSISIEMFYLIKHYFTFELRDGSAYYIKKHQS